MPLTLVPLGLAGLVLAPRVQEQVCLLHQLAPLLLAHPQQHLHLLLLLPRLRLLLLLLALLLLGLPLQLLLLLVVPQAALVLLLLLCLLVHSPQSLFQHLALALVSWDRSQANGAWGGQGLCGPLFG